MSPPAAVPEQTDVFDRYRWWVLFGAGLPLAFIVRARAVRGGDTRIAIIQDMDNQPMSKPQARSPIFADERAMRPVIPGTVARGELRDDERFYRGKVNDEWITEFPMTVTEIFVRRGQQRFDIFCATCHGLTGAGKLVLVVTMFMGRIGLLALAIPRSRPYPVHVLDHPQGEVLIG